MKKLGFLGIGSMGGAVLDGMLAAGYIGAEDVAVCRRDEAKLHTAALKHPGLTCTTSAAELVRMCHMIVLGVKPQMLGDVLKSVQANADGRAFVSMAAGWRTEQLQESLRGTTATVLRVMPNTPALVGAAMTAICAENTLTDEDFAFAKGVFDAIGKTAILPERLFDGVIAISGSSPAYVFMMIEAMADAGVREGLPRSIAYSMAAQSVLGSAKMILETGKHPGELKDSVCSPAGATIDAVAVLEKRGFRAAVMEAMEACAAKARDMTK